MDKQRKEIVLRPSDIRYTQNTISNKFIDGTLIGRLLDDIVIGRCFVSAIKMIEVKLVDGLWYSADNRRLWVFKQLEYLGHCPFITVKVIRKINWEKCTSENGGRDVSIRGGEPGGIWFSKAEEIRQNLKKDSSVIKGRKRKIKLAKSKLCSSKTVCPNDVQSSKCPVFQPNALQFVRKNTTKLQKDTSDEKLSKPDTSASLQVKISKKKRKGKNIEKVKKEAAKTDAIEIPMEVSRDEAHVTDDKHLELTLPMKNDNETNDKASVIVRKKRRRGKKRKLKQNTENELYSEQSKLSTSLSEADGYNDGNLNHFYDENTFLDAYDDNANYYIDSDDDFCNDPGNIWLNSVYHVFALNNQNNEICNSGTYIFDADDFGGAPEHSEPETGYPVKDYFEAFVSHVRSCSDLAHSELSSAHNVGPDKYFLPTVEKFSLTSGSLDGVIDKDELQSNTRFTSAYEDTWQLDKGLVMGKELNGEDTNDKTDIETKAQLCGAKKEHMTLGSLMTVDIERTCNVMNEVDNVYVNDCYKTDKASKRNCIIL